VSIQASFAFSRNIDTLFVRKSFFCATRKNISIFPKGEIHKYIANKKKNIREKSPNKCCTHFEWKEKRKVVSKLIMLSSMGIYLSIYAICIYI
jgi:hypothetical protein